MTSPSRFAERVLSIVVRDPEWRECVIGDLREEHAKIVARVGAVRARRWHTRQSLGIACRYGAHRLFRRGTPARRWLAMSLSGDLRRAVAAADPDLPIAEILSMEQLVEDRVAGLSFIAGSLGVFGIVSTNLLQLVALVAGLAAAALLAAYLPARRAASLNPTIALRDY